MARLSDADRAAFVQWWSLVSDAAQSGLTVTDTIASANAIARSGGESISFATNTAISRLYGYARREVNASVAFQNAAPGTLIDSSMISTPPYARDESEQNTYALYHVKFAYTYLDAAGELQTTIKTSAQPLTIGPTVDDVADNVMDDAEAFANKYGHTLVSAVPLMILAVLTMRVLVACEFSGVVREAFNAAGHYAVSCDLEPSEIPGNHYQCDVRQVLHGSWDMMIAFPPCTHLARSGYRYHYETPQMYDALSFVGHLMAAPIPRIAIENPIGAISRHLRPHDQVVQPHWFGDPYVKATCLWLTNLPRLKPQDSVGPPWVSAVDKTPDTPERARERSRTFQGLARAMADQWGQVTM